MARDGLHGETKHGRWPVHIAGVKRARVTRTVEYLFKEWRPATVAPAEYARNEILMSGLAHLLYRGYWRRLYRTLGFLLGERGTPVPATAAASAPRTAVSARDGRPPREHSRAVSDAETRRLLGASRTPQS